MLVWTRQWGVFAMSWSRSLGLSKGSGPRSLISVRYLLRVERRNADVLCRGPTSEVALQMAAMMAV